MKERKIDSDTLFDLYIIKNMNIVEIANLLNISQSAIGKKLKKYNIKKDRQIIVENTKKTNIKRRGKDYAKIKPETLEKRKATNREKYGTENPMKNEEIRKKAREKLKERNLDDNKRKETLKKREETCMKKYGVKNVSKLKEIQEKKKQTCLKNNGVDNIFKSMKFIEDNRNNYYKKTGLKNPAQSLEVRKKMVKKAKNSKSNIDKSRFDSGYERDVYDFCLRNGIEIQDRQIPLEYEYLGEKHVTFIDFKIDGYLIECKGGHLLGGMFDYAMKVPVEEKIELYKKNHVIIVTDTKGSEYIPKSESKESNGLKYLNKCPNPLIGIDIELFKNPKIPYKEDRPECFYDVRVDGKLSVSEAWNDEKLRWKMIKNRIEYVGGFIDNKSILTAMNVTRTCKQPSWFSKKYAKKLIEEYITTDIVLDPFAGWGTRCDACKELNKKYYGWDLNKELVEWHQQQGRTFDTGNGIEYGDANNVKTVREECSVFICPPYTDFEQYFEGQDLKTTQCEWLNIVMKNIPNAKEYLMVCKVVDLGWEKYIVEEKINKSHFGTNKEYVLLIKNSQI